MAPRRRSSNKRTAPHPTATRLLDATIELIDNSSIDEVQLVAVLEHSGVSHGSLYHHFEDFPDLVEQAIVARYLRGLNDAVAAIAQLRECADAVEFQTRVEQIITQFHAGERRNYRLARLETLGSLNGRPRLAAALGQVQREHLEQQAELYAEFQQRGWLRDDIDPLLMSTFTSALFLGRAVDDISDRPVDAEQWTALMLEVYRPVLFPN